MKHSKLKIVGIIGVCVGQIFASGPYEKCEEDFKRSRYDNASRCFERSFPAFSDVAAQVTSRARLNYAESLLAQGNFIDGFREFDARLQFRAPLLKPWDGSDPRGKTILVRCEQGLGDTFFFLRYVSLLKDLGAKTIVLGQNPLKSLLSNCPFIDQVIKGNDPMPAFDADVYLMSLSRYLSQNNGMASLRPTSSVDVIPNVGQYMFAPADRIAFWRNQLPQGVFKIGVCWRASALPAGQVRYLDRDFPLTMLAHIAKIPGVKLFNLLEGFHAPIRQSAYDVMKASGNADANKLKDMAFNVIPDDFPVIGGFQDFDKVGPFIDTAAVIYNMDLIISADTSVPNLAGAMAKPVWILLPYESDWRWGDERNHQSPWVQSATLFWQKEQGDWSHVAQEITETLSHAL